MTEDTSEVESQLGHRALAWVGVCVAIVIPSIITWVYFFQVADASQAVQRSVMATVKVLQFAFPLVWAGAVLGDRLGWPRRTTAGLLPGLTFGLAATICGWVLYVGWLRECPWFVAAVEPIRAKIAAFGLDATWKFVVLGAFYSLIHSLLEEYYWRWFVFGQLRRLVPMWSAVIVSAVGFAAHHVLVLSSYFDWWSAPTLLLSSAVALGGAYWAWLYARSGSLYGPWLSHAVIDAGIFLVGYSMIYDRALM